MHDAPGRNGESVTNAAQRTGTRRGRIYDGLTKGTIPGWRRGRTWHVDPAWVDRMAALPADERRIQLGHLPRQLGAARLALLRAVAGLDRHLIAFVGAAAPTIPSDAGENE